ncbi:S-adenosyl-L-methionine-dependent methyltransferase [Rickenella mellea]|uniref:S-adenosyl-L-methionine-dependent methyltransferase n=1 Tax=Rickenella mellea TaxID=50990 RepID=A0A4Y7QN02_9AGAM|nr:S-adenosyl-L-methionine-dependent methyltransferase [Rickenella mellea]
MLPTPDLSHLTKEDFIRVYEPAEDTFILLDGLENDAVELQNLDPKICLEIGSGSGCVSAFVGKLLGSSRCLYLTTDINPYASKCTVSTGKQNAVPIESITASLDSPLALRLRRNVDLLIFNPPYVPTSSEEADAAQESRGIGGSWAGGTDGMEITGLFLNNLPNLLSTNGRFYLVGVAVNNISAIHQNLRGLRLDGKVILHRRAGREHLYVMKFMRILTP